MPDDDQQDWRRGPQAEFIRAVQQEQVAVNQAEMNATLRALQITEAQQQARIAQKQAEALNRYRPPLRRPNPLPPQSLVIGETPLPLTTSPQGIVNIPERWEEVREQWTEARAEARGERDQAKTREEARMLLRDALNAGVASGLFSEERALGIIALTGINNQPFPPREASANIRLALEQAAQSKVISRQLVNRLWSTLIAEIQIEGAAPQFDEEPNEAFQDLLYDALTLRPCHLPEHLDWHVMQTICASQQVRISEEILDSLGLTPRFLPRVPHQDAQGRPLECCEDEATQRWLRTGLTDSIEER